MKLNTVLFKQHLGVMFRRHWKVQGKKMVRDNGALKVLQEKEMEYEDAIEFISGKRNQQLPYIKSSMFHELQDREVKFDESHPDYKPEKCLTYKNHNVLLEGLKQAQVLTNSIILNHETLPVTKDIQPEQELLIQDKLVRRCIRSSLLFDAWQEKLPRRHDPEREAWQFPRDYGITDKRRNYLLVRRLLQLCSSLSPQLLNQRNVLNSADFKLPFTLKNGERLLFSVKGDAVVLSNINPPVGASDMTPSSELPNLDPLLPTVSLEPTNFYQFEPHYPIPNTNKLNKLHTIIFHFNETEVSNLFESPVTLDQILGRTLVHSWVYAMSQGLNQNEKANEPVTVQTVQTDGKFFHFGVFKLCSRRVDSEAPRNLFWSFPLMNLFDSCSYSEGIPVLEGYNPVVFKTLLAFYNNS